MREQDMAIRDHFMSATEAKAWGIVDHVYETREAAEAAS